MFVIFKLFCGAITWPIYRYIYYIDHYTVWIYYAVLYMPDAVSDIMAEVF